MTDDSKPFVEQVRIQNFGCVHDATLELTRLHALIGPNDSGKSTVLSALFTTCELIRRGQNQLTNQGRLDPRGVNGSKISLATNSLELVCSQKGAHWMVQSGARGSPLGHGLSLAYQVSNELPAVICGASLVRWDPDVIRRPCALIPEGQPLVVGERGEGLAAVYEAILSRDRGVFGEIEAGVQRLFPTIKGIWLPTSADAQKELGVTLVNGARINARTLSEGLLYSLAFAVVPYLDPTGILLVEEPENGLHPSRIAEVMKSLREVSQTMQVILATHSPLVINELQPEEVTILTRDPQAGTRATRIDRTKHFQQRQKVYALGELWLSFADGDAEAALVSDETTPSAG